MIESFFTEIDREWPQDAQGPKVRLRIIGCGALILQASYERGTKDSDVFETAELTGSTKQRLLEIAGPGSELSRRSRLYIDIVGNGIPFLPHAPIWHPVSELNATLAHLELVVLDVVDVVVSKLKRFHANDQSDIDAMIERRLVPHARLVDRFRAARTSSAAMRGPRTCRGTSRTSTGWSETCSTCPRRRSSCRRGSDRRGAPGRARQASSTWRTLRRRASGVIGFWR